MRNGTDQLIIGWFTQYTDTEDNMFGIIEMDEKAQESIPIL
ncbi:MAG: hypothetical protein ACE5RM_04350 [Candidatus Nitrosomaritimum aestuariumsis]